MQKKDRFLKIRDFLNEFKFFHEKEMMEHYPYGFGPYETWVNELMKFSSQELCRFDFYLDTHNIKESSFLDFLKKAKELLNLELTHSLPSPLSEGVKKKLTLKKTHEISTLLSFMQPLLFERLIDVGGGIGHLAMATVYHLNKKAICLDMDEELQKIGKKKIQRWLPSLQEKMIFIPKKFDQQTKLNDYPTSGTLLTGLHACGPLSTHLVKLAANKNISYFINFGCCYHKLKDEYNLSTIAQENAIWFTKHALTIAAKSNTLMQEKDLQDKYRVKRYRYALHFYLKKVHKLPFTKIGNTHPQDYAQDFAFFMRKYASPYLGGETTDEMLNHFYQSAQTQLAIERTIRAGLIRSILGRLIEIYIILDRALYLEEKGLKSEVISFFNPQISPRNILLFAQGSQP